MRLSKMHKRVINGSFNARYNTKAVPATPTVEEGHYGKWGWEGPNKADKGKRLGSCNITRCQRPGAYWYNKVMDAWYCSECADGINYRPLDDGTYLCTIDYAARKEYIKMAESVGR